MRHGEDVRVDPSYTDDPHLAMVHADMAVYHEMELKYCHECKRCAKCDGVCEGTAWDCENHCECAGGAS